MKIIINIGRQLGSGGHIIAQQLAKDFGCKFYDKELLNLAAKESGFSEKFFEQNDERKVFFKAFNFLRAFSFHNNNMYENEFSQEGLYKFQSDAIRRAADEGSCVFVGRTADYVLRDYAGVVNVFVTAHLEDRVKAVASYRNVDEGTARKIIEEGESSRASYYNYYTGKKWGHSESYDLCVNSSLLGLEGTEQFVADFIRKRFGL